MVDGRGKTIIKSRGIGRNPDESDILNYGDFLQMASGKGVVKLKTMFEIRGGDVYINDRKIRVAIKNSMISQVEKQVKDILESVEKVRDPALYINEEKIRIAKEIASLYNKSDQEIKEIVSLYNKSEEKRYVTGLYYSPPNPIDN